MYNACNEYADDKHMTQKSEIGKLGEDLACKYLKSNGYLIIDRNFRKPWGELDIVARQKDGTLVFVEVKAMRQLPDPAIESGNENMAIAGLTPEENLTKAKLQKLKRTASLFAGHNQELVSDKKGWRIDLVAIQLLTDSIESDEDYKLRHFQNI